MADAVDYYAVLGVAPTSDDVVIRAAYRALMLKYHPDTNTDARSTLKAAQINEAYKVLSDAFKRAQYDKLRSETQGPSAACNDSKATSAGDKPDLRRHPGSWLFVGVLGLAVVASLDEKQTPTATAKRSSSTMITAAAVAPVGLPLTPATAPVTSSTSDVLPDLQSPKAIAFEDMEAAAVRFDRVSRRSGIIGAKAFSRGCHRGFALHPNWTTADRCAAFDFAAAHIDSGMNTVSKGLIRQNDYFIFEDENQADNYASFRATPELIGDRLARIRRAATLAVERVINDRIENEKVQRAGQSVVNSVATKTSPSSERPE